MYFICDGVVFSAVVAMTSLRIAVLGDTKVGKSGENISVYKFFIFNVFFTMKGSTELVLCYVCNLWAAVAASTSPVTTPVVPIAPVCVIL